MTNPPPSEDLPRPRRLALIPALVALVVVVGYALSLSLLLGYDDRDGAIGLFAALSSALTCAFALALVPFARRWVATRASHAIALTLASLGLLPLLAASSKLADPLISTHWRCGTGEIALVMLGPMLAAGGGVFAAIVSRFALPRLGVRGAAVLRGLSALALALSVTAVLGGAFAVASKPQAADHIAQLPVAGEIPAITVTPSMPARIDDVGGTLIWRLCDESGCMVSLRAPVATSESMNWGQVRVGPGALRVHLDRRANLAILRAVREPTHVIAFDLRTRRGVDVQWRSLAGIVAPPVSWLASGALGLLVALAVFARGGASLRALATWRQARPATLTEEGTVIFGEDLPAAKVQGVAAAPAGPVLVRGDTSATHLREMSTVPADALRAGTHTDLEAALAVSASGRLALSAAVAAWMALPLALALRVLGVH